MLIVFKIVVLLFVVRVGWRKVVGFCSLFKLVGNLREFSKFSDKSKINTIFWKTLRNSRTLLIVGLLILSIFIKIFNALSVGKYVYGWVYWMLCKSKLSKLWEISQAKKSSYNTLKSVLNKPLYLTPLKAIFQPH